MACRERRAQRAQGKSSVSGLPAAFQAGRIARWQTGSPGQAGRATGSRNVARSINTQACDSGGSGGGRAALLVQRSSFPWAPHRYHEPVCASPSKMLFARLGVGHTSRLAVAAASGSSTCCAVPRLANAPTSCASVRRHLDGPWRPAAMLAARLGRRRTGLGRLASLRLPRWRDNVLGERLKVRTRRMVARELGSPSLLLAERARGRRGSLA